MTDGGGRRGLFFLLTLVAAVGGVIAIVLAVTSQQSPPQPAPSAAGTISSAGRTPAPSATPSTEPSASATPTGKTPSASSAPSQGSVPLTYSVPTFLDIAAIDVHSEVIQIGKTAKGALAVPKGPDIDKAAWFENSPTPGQLGPAVIEGHVDTVQGPSVFFELGALRPGNNIRVTRADGSVAIFAVNAVRAYPTKAQFPTSVVYGGDLGQATLRLITCSNFDDGSGRYLGNTVVFADLTAIRHPRTS